MKGKSWWLYTLFLLPVGILGFYICFSWYDYYHRKQLASEAIVRIENYKNKNGKLPENLSDVGLIESEDTVVQYQKNGDTEYIVWFGLSLGESATYSSESRQWNDNQ